MKQAVLAFGTNQGDRADYLRRALAAVGALPHTEVTAVSSVYETDPVGYTDQPDFYNMLAVVRTALSPRALLGACLGIEAALGRVRTFANAPRVIDVDLLLMEGETAADAELTLPHPRMWERGFVMVPLCELFPEKHACGVDFAGVSVDKSGVRRITEKNLKKIEKRG